MVPAEASLKQKTEKKRGHNKEMMFLHGDTSRKKQRNTLKSRCRNSGLEQSGMNKHKSKYPSTCD